MTDFIDALGELVDEQLPDSTRQWYHRFQFRVQRHLHMQPGAAGTGMTVLPWELFGSAAENHAKRTGLQNVPVKVSFTVKSYETQFISSFLSNK